MAQTINLGRNGDQPFSITADGVSSQHARITIDGEQWQLEDLNSTNGTYIREESGRVRRITKLDITPMTFIYLGPMNANGCCFYAHQVINPGDFHKDFRYIYNKYNEMEDNIKKEERLNWYIRLGTMLVTLVLIFMVHNIQMMRLAAMISPLVSLLWVPNRRMQKLRKKYTRFFDCPNPKCTNNLAPSSIERMRCPECRNKI